MSNYVSVSLEDWCALQGAAAKLEALEAAGVDNWEGYSVALQSLEDSDD